MDELRVKDYGKQYFDPANEAGFTGARNLLRVNSKGKKINEEERTRIEQWLSGVDAYTLHRPIRKKFSRLFYNVTNIDDVWEADLCQLTTIKDENDGYSYLLVVIDVVSKYAFVEILRNKEAKTVAAAFGKILERSNDRVPVYLQTDRGKEFLGVAFQNMLKKHGIRFRVARNPDIKCSIAERFNKTIQQRLWRIFTHRNSRRYIDVIQKVVESYNATPHSTIKMRPKEVTVFNAAKARENMLKRALSNRRLKVKKPIYAIGDYVRISRAKGTIAKGFEKNFTEEIFKVSRVALRQNIYTYELADLNDTTIDGFFYSEELVRVSRERLSENQKFKIDRIIETKGRGKRKKYLVAWKGWGPEFNSWVGAEDIETV